MTTEQQLEKMTKELEQIKTMLHLALGNLPSSRKWGSLQEAQKILDRSASWYKEARNGESYSTKSKVQFFLTEGVDWRRVGGEVEYNMTSIERLKQTIINKKAPADTEAH